MPSPAVVSRKHAPQKPKPLYAFASGSGRRVTLKGERPCIECGATVTMHWRGASDSLGARLSRQWLRKGARVLCDECLSTEDQQIEVAEHAERRRSAAALRLGASGVPQRWRAVSFERLEHDAARKPAMEAAQAWAAEPSARGLLLHGPYGRGKTVIAAAAAMARLEHGCVRWLSVAKLLHDLRMPFDSTEYRRALRSIDSDQARGALVLDDLDKVPAKDHSLAPLYTAINGWLERPLPLLVTMNRSPDELAEWAGESFGEALASRLVGYSKVFEVKGRDRRMD